MKRVLYLFILLSALLNAYAAGGKSYHFQRAEEAYQQKNYDECIRISELGVQENPKDGYCWALLAEIYSKRAYGEYAKALEAADMALKYIPKNDAKWKTTLIYFGVYAGLMFFLGLMVFLLTRGKNNPFSSLNFWVCQKIAWWSAFSPAVLGMILGFVLSGNTIGSMAFVLLASLRIMWLSMRQLRPLQ